MSSKRGFVVSQAMLYAFGLIVIVLIFFWGYKSLHTFSTMSDKSELNNFKEKFSSDLETLSFKKDSIKEFNYDLSSSYDKLCVFDLEQTSNINATIMTYYPLLKEEVKDKVDNIFLVGKNKIYSFKSDFITISKYPYYYCIPILKGKLKFNGKGAVYNGEVTTQIVMDTIAKKKLTDSLSGFIPTANPNEYTSTSESKLYSTDNYAYIKILQGTTITLPEGKDYISLEVTYSNISNSGSEEYIVGPNGTTFSQNIILGITPNAGGKCNDHTNYDISGIIYLGCDGNFVMYSIDKFS